MSEGKNIWDDSLLVKAYDDSVTLANETLARRIAVATNRREEIEIENANTDLASTSEAEQVVFKVGDFARATYTDGIDYEGTLVSIDEKASTCVLRYVGYENEQEVPLNDLLSSWGSKARREQIQCAKREEVQDDQQKAQQRAKSAKKSMPKTRHAATGSCMGIPGSGLAVPPMPLVPPMFAPNGGMIGEPEQDFVAMLTAWYMSGYYTGLYQGKKESSAKKKAAKK